MLTIATEESRTKDLLGFFRVGTLLSGHVVNDPHLRKQEQAHKDLIIACKVCISENLYVAI